ncbi:hypothetical protein C8F01DRAFT_1261844 [Mycena amicta]|nr:hypothetical protein C8F01DRAFT_1261844 [Mycena amicta]
MPIASERTDGTMERLPLTEATGPLASFGLLHFQITEWSCAGFSGLRSAPRTPRFKLCLIRAYRTSLLRRIWIARAGQECGYRRGTRTVFVLRPRCHEMIIYPDTLRLALSIAPKLPACVPRTLPGLRMSTRTATTASKRPRRCHVIASHGSRIPTSAFRNSGECIERCRTL